MITNVNDYRTHVKLTPFLALLFEDIRGPFINLYFFIE